ncbi:hypothetical protein BRADI_3g40259v3 [Brachypodium distachyon]|uniref:Uncharacterized protein n=1 Tax=Brachypodium distachyon TaxID=15368 RepID=A0A0Q3FI71_BRADI|nr:hypothetical protein BRADI_3g40259v3 [Brachypodium distachyon]
MREIALENSANQYQNPSPSRLLLPFLRRPTRVACISSRVLAPEAISSHRSSATHKTSERYGEFPSTATSGQIEGQTPSFSALTRSICALVLFACFAVWFLSAQETCEPSRALPRPRDARLLPRALRRAAARRAQPPALQCSSQPINLQKQDEGVAALHMEELQFMESS